MFFSSERHGATFLLLVPLIRQTFAQSDKTFFDFKSPILFPSKVAVYPPKVSTVPLVVVVTVVVVTSIIDISVPIVTRVGIAGSVFVARASSQPYPKLFDRLPCKCASCTRAARAAREARAARAARAAYHPE